MTDIAAPTLKIEECTQFVRRLQRSFYYIKSQGNDLITPAPQFGFPGLVAGDKWCVCALSWIDAYNEGIACPIVLEACDSSVLEHISLSALKEHAVEDE